MKRIVVSGCGVAGSAVAMHLTRLQKGLDRPAEVVVVDPLPPLTGTSGYSSECYRNFFTDAPIVPMMARSIELMEQLDRDHQLNMNRRGYVFMSQTKDGGEKLAALANGASECGAGPVRVHTDASSYVHSAPMGLGSPDDEHLFGFDLMQVGDHTVGADGFSTDVRTRGEINKLYPYLSPGVSTLMHCRRGGWLDAAGLGAAYIKEAKTGGAKFVHGSKISEVKVNQGLVSGVELTNHATGAVETIECDAFVNASGAWLQHINGKIEGSPRLPMTNKVICKVMLYDEKGVIPEDAPFLFWSDNTTVPWTPDMAEALEELDDTAEGGITNTKEWLKTQPMGQHIRPCGNKRVIVLYEHAHQHVTCGDGEGEPEFPINSLIDYFPDLCVEAVGAMVPGVKQYSGALTQDTYKDAGYYCTNTLDERPIASQHGSIPNSFVCGTLGGWGIMSSSAVGELCAMQVLGQQTPSYAGAFTLPRTIPRAADHLDPMR